jgi:hypothetical protein
VVIAIKEVPDYMLIQYLLQDLSKHIIVTF